jgi:hypothetical protein
LHHCLIAKGNSNNAQKLSVIGFAISYTNAHVRIRGRIETASQEFKERNRVKKGCHKKVVHRETISL